MVLNGTEWTQIANTRPNGIEVAHSWNSSERTFADGHCELYTSAHPERDRQCILLSWKYSLKL